MTKKIIKSQYQKNYINHYLKINSIYPSVFSLKMFLGRNPDLNFSSDNTDFSGKSCDRHSEENSGIQTLDF